MNLITVYILFVGNIIADVYTDEKQAEAELEACRRNFPTDVWRIIRRNTVPVNQGE